MSPLLNSSKAAKDSPVRHFSAFPLTSHMHLPTLRLVSLHPLLSVTMTFARVPEIHETFTWKVFFTRASTAKEVINTVVEELGLARSLPVHGAGTLEYVLEEVFEDGKFQPELCSSELFLVLTSSQAKHDSHPQFVYQSRWRQHRRNHPRTRLPTVSAYLMSGIEGIGQELYPRVP